MNVIIQVGNIREEKNFSNPQTGRIYSVYGICPTLNTFGGGQREIKVLINEECKTDRSASKIRQHI